jgi:transcription antitermination factor NusG
MSEQTQRPEIKSWYAIRVHPKSERSVSLAIEAKGYEQFLPAYRVTKQRSDRIKKLELPLFPGYLFCRLNLTERLMPLLTTPGVHSIVGAGKVPVAIPEREIEAVRVVVRSGLAAQPCPNLTVGDPVFIEKGPLAGLEGVAVDVAHRCRLVLSVPLLQRSVSVAIDRSWVRQISQSRSLQHNPRNGTASAFVSEM